MKSDKLRSILVILDSPVMHREQKARALAHLSASLQRIIVQANPELQTLAKYLRWE